MKTRRGFCRLAEEKGEKAHKEAIAMGLKYGGFGYWKDPQTNETKFKTVNDQLVPVEPEEEAELAAKGGPGEGGGRPDPMQGGPGGPAGMGLGATQQPPNQRQMQGMNVGTAEPGQEQLDDVKSWEPGPDGDHCVDSNQPPGEVADDAFVGKTNYYQWTAGPDGTNFKNVSFDELVKLAQSGQKNQGQEDSPLAQDDMPIAEENDVQKIAGNKKPSRPTLQKAQSALNKMPGPQRIKQLQSMLDLQDNSLYGTQSKNDLTKKKMTALPYLARDSSMVNEMNHAVQPLVKDPNFPMDLGEELGEGSFGQVAQSPHDPNVVVKMGEIGMNELTSLYRMRGNKGFPNLINAKFSGPWDGEDEFDAAATGTFAMSKVPGQELSSWSPMDTDYEPGEDGETNMDRIARKIWQLRGQMHRAGLAHNDLHGGNIFIDDDQNVSFVDMGMSNNDPLAALHEALGGIGLQDYDIPAGMPGAGDYQLAKEARWKSLPAGLADKLSESAEEIRGMILDNLEPPEGEDDENDPIYNVVENFMNGGVRLRKDNLESLREMIPYLGNKKNVMKLIEVLYRGVGGTDTENRMSNAFDKRQADSKIIRLANALRKKRGESKIGIKNKNVVPPKNLDFDD